MWIACYHLSFFGYGYCVDYGVKHAPVFDASFVLEVYFSGFFGDFSVDVNDCAFVLDVVEYG